jgi:Zn-dependent membrane protease YugP
MPFMPFWWMPPGNPLFTVVLPLAAFLVAILTQARVKSAFARFQRVPTRSGLSGAEVAELLLKSRGITDVRVEPTQGFLRDHYDPTTKTLRLSTDVYEGRSVAALGVAAHETGHALQHADAYAWLTMRSTIVPAVTFVSRLGQGVFGVGMLLLMFSWNARGNSPMVHHVVLPMLWIAAAGLAAVVVFSVVTLPVEIDASKRAMRLLESAGVLVGDEVEGARTVLSAAAWTYVAAAASAIVELLRLLAIISSLSGRDRNRN